MEEIIFKPRYAFSFWFEFCLLLFWTALAGLFSVGSGQLFFWWLVILIGTIASLVYLILNRVKCILFQQNAMVIQYTFRPSREVEYSEISDIGEETIQAGKFRLSLAEYSNRTKLLPIIKALKNSGRISESRLDGKLKKNEELAKAAAAIALLGTITALMTVPFILGFWFPAIHFEFSSIIEWSFLVVFLVALAVLKIRASRR